MSTPNFHTQNNFKLYVQAFEPISKEEYQAEFFPDDDYYYADYEGAETAEEKAEILKQIEAEKSSEIYKLRKELEMYKNGKTLDPVSIV